MQTMTKVAQWKGKAHGYKRTFGAKPLSLDKRRNMIIVDITSHILNWKTALSREQQKKGGGSKTG